MADSKKIDDGGAAFAHAVVTVDGNGQPLTPGEADALQIGLTVRDWFAGQVVQASIAGHIAHYGHDNHWPAEGIAAYSYEIADAMIAARKGGA